MTSRYCSDCGKALKACICSTITLLDSSLEIIILQHPTEQHRPMGTARILSLSLPNSRLYIGEDFSEHDELNELLKQPATHTFVLFPEEQSEELDKCRAMTDDSIEAVRVIILDGTWKKAYKMWQLSKNLHDLPTVKLPSDLQGNYRIRKAPSDNALSTVEAGYHLLTLWEEGKDFSPLINSFNHMIEFQIAQMPEGVYERNYLKAE